MLITKLLMK